MTGRLTSLVEKHRTRLDELFDGGDYEIEDSGPESCVVRAAAVELVLSYDRRDGWVVSTVRPLLLPAEVQEGFPSHLWLRFLEETEPARARRTLDETALLIELELLRPVLKAAGDPQKARDAIFFIRGYNAGYSEHYSAEFDDSV